MASSFFMLLAILGLVNIATVTSSPLSTLNDTLVNLRIEGAEKTIFEGHILSRGHNITTHSSNGSHHCDGTNHGAHPTPGATPTSALDDASQLDHFDWDGLFYPDLDDFLVTRIDNTSETSNSFWRLFVNFKAPNVGGCQVEVQTTDQVLWAFDGFNRVTLLNLTGPTHGTVNKPITVTVTNGSTGTPISGASVYGHLTDSNGHADLTFTTIGWKHLKAEKSYSTRSNLLGVLISGTSVDGHVVYSQGQAPLTFTDVGRNIVKLLSRILLG